MAHLCVFCGLSHLSRRLDTCGRPQESGFGGVA
jgi:hypothetical protein